MEDGRFEEKRVTRVEIEAYSWRNSLEIAAPSGRATETGRIVLPAREAEALRSSALEDYEERLVRAQHAFAAALGRSYATGHAPRLYSDRRDMREQEQQ